MPETLHLKVARNIVVQKAVVTLGDIAKLSCTDPEMEPHLRQIELYRFRDGITGKKRIRRQQVFSILYVIDKIERTYPKITVQNEGEMDFVIEYRPGPPESKWMEGLKVTALCIVIFFGSAFTIMAFNNDISITELFDKFYFRVMQQKSDGFTELEVGYAIGMAFSIVFFFNHIGKKKITHDPTPLQVEMRKYEQDVDTTFIENCSRKGHNIDVD
ncbi:MAG: stage V sporulation protein AA [Lachnospiraceae bacterium]